MAKREQYSSRGRRLTASPARVSAPVPARTSPSPARAPPSLAPPSHLNNITTAFRESAHALQLEWLWQYRQLVIACALGFVLHGAHALLLLDRSQWIFPIIASRWLLVLHWAFATPFLAGVLFQRLGIGWVASAGPRGRRVHRVVGIATLLCSLGASLSALCLAQSSLGGLTGRLAFALWSLAWTMQACYTWWAAAHGQWDVHRLGAEGLCRTGLSFAAGRMVLAACVRTFDRWDADQSGTIDAEESFLAHATLEKRQITVAYEVALVITLIWALWDAKEVALAHRRASAQAKWHRAAAVARLAVRRGRG